MVGFLRLTDSVWSLSDSIANAATLIDGALRVRPWAFVAVEAQTESSTCAGGATTPGSRHSPRFGCKRSPFRGLPRPPGLPGASAIFATHRDERVDRTVVGLRLERTFRHARIHRRSDRGCRWAIGRTRLGGQEPVDAAGSRGARADRGRHRRRSGWGAVSSLSAGPRDRRRHAGGSRRGAGSLCGAG